MVFPQLAFVYFGAPPASPTPAPQPDVERGWFRKAPPAPTPSPPPVVAQDEGVICGLRLLDLPDLLATVKAPSEQAQIEIFLQRWVSMVANLWQWRGAAFSLRFLIDPERRKVEIGFLLRVSGPQGAARSRALAIVQHITQVLGQLQIRTVPLTEPQALARFHNPFPRTYLCELRQREEAVQLQAISDSFYTVYHFWRPGGEWLTPFELALQNPAPSLINVHLEPTTLSDPERQGFAYKASFGQQLGRGQLAGTYYSNGHVPPDPQAALSGHIFARNVQRLQEPFLLTAQVASPSEHAAGQVARSLGTTIMEAAYTTSDQGIQLPAAYTIHMIASNDTGAQQAVGRTFLKLILTDWGGMQTPQGQERLRFLADAQGAAAAFRLPVASWQTARGAAPIDGLTTVAVSRAHLVSALADLYPLTTDTYRLVDSAEIPRMHIAFHAKGIDTWNEVLGEAVRRGKLLLLLSLARADYPDDERLQQTEQVLTHAAGE